MWFACNGKSSDAKMDCTRDESSFLPGVSESEALFLCKVRARGSSESGALKTKKNAIDGHSVRARVCVHALKTAPNIYVDTCPLAHRCPSRKMSHDESLMTRVTDMRRFVC